MTTQAKVETTAANLPKDGETIPPPQPAQVAEDVAPVDFWTVEKAQGMIAYAANMAANATSNEKMKASRFELEIGGPLLAPWLNKHLPQVPGGDENQALLVIFVVFFVGLRAIELQRDYAVKKAARPPAPPREQRTTAGAGPSAAASNGQRAERVEDLLGGQVGSGTL